MNITTEETITEDNWDVTTAGREMKRLCNQLSYAVGKGKGLDEIEYLVAEVSKKMQYINDNCE